MDPYMPMSNSLSALPWVRLLIRLYRPDAADALSAKLRELSYRMWDEQFFPATPTRPAFYYARMEDAQYLLIGGASSNAMATLLTTGYMGRVNPDIRNPQNEYLNDTATSIVQTLKDRFVPAPINLRIGGFSLGGAVGQLIGVACQVLNWGDNRGNIITFGSPKVHGHRHNANIHLAGRCVRYMNDDDPVPLFCPSAIDYPAIIGIVGPIHAARLSNFGHPTGGTILDREGVMRAGNVPDVSTLTFGANLANWLWDIEALGGNPHALAEYEKRLILYETANPGRHAIPQAPPQQGEIVRRDEMNQAEQRVVDVIAATGLRQGSVPVVIPKDKAFRWVRVGRVNCVAFGDKLVTVTNTKRRALRLANSGNDFLRVLQRQAIVDPVSMAVQFDNYFQAAIHGELGFKPAMNVIWPTIGN